MRWLGLLVINAAVLFALWCLAAGIRAVGQDALGWLGSSRTAYDWRIDLPSFGDPKETRRILAEQAAAPIEFASIVEWRHAPHRGENLHVDERGRRVHPDREPGVAIGFFGGSAMWGEGVRDDETIPAAFDAATRGWAVTNYGEHGWVVRQGFAELVHLFRLGELPTVVVFYDGFNDVVHLCDAANTTSINGTGQERRMRERLGHRRQSETWTHLVAPFLPDGFGQPLPDRHACASDQRRAEAIADALVRTWDLAHLLVTSQGGRFYAFLQPNAYVGAPRTDYLPASESRDLRERDLFEAQFDRIYPRIQAALTSRPWAEDLTTAFDGDSAVYTDMVHVSSEGNREIAARMRARIEADGLPAVAP